MADQEILPTLIFQLLFRCESYGVHQSMEALIISSVKVQVEKTAGVPLAAHHFHRKMIFQEKLFLVIYIVSGNSFLVDF